MIARRRNRLEDAVDEGAGVHAGDLLQLGGGRLAPLKGREGLRVESRQNRFQPGRAFRVSAARVVLKARRMGV